MTAAPRDELDCLADAVGIKLAALRAEINEQLSKVARKDGGSAPTGKNDPLGALADAVGIAMAEEREATSAAIAKASRGVEEVAAPAVAMAEARLATLLRRRTETLSVVRYWLERCAEDAA
jgi:hypothetical protein